MKRVGLFLKKLSGRGAGGQSLVEMAVATPLLIFMMIGVFEVGWALRNYLVLVNVNREITRFAIRPGYMNFATMQATQQSYERVKVRAMESVGQQLNIDFNNDDSATLIISHIVVDTGKPCLDIDDSSCDCNKFKTDPDYNPFPQDDIIIHPQLTGYGYQTRTFGPAATVTGERKSRLKYDDLIEDLAAQNNEFNCQIMKKDGVPASNNVIVTEMFYDLPQLFGFPLISNPYTDPIPLYTHTIMRMVGGVRSSGSVEGNITNGIDSIGPICLVYPMLANGNNPDPVQNIIQNGWLIWRDPVPSPAAGYLEDTLLYPQMSLNDYATPGGVQKDSQVNKTTGVYPELVEEVAPLAGVRIVIPVSNNPGAAKPKVDGFTWATLNNAPTVDDLNNGVVMATLDTFSLPEACQPPIPAP